VACCPICLFLWRTELLVLMKPVAVSFPCRDNPRCVAWHRALRYQQYRTK
jgi:hypothetical protein